MSVMLLGVPVSLALGARRVRRAARAGLVRPGRLAVGVPGRRRAGRAARAGRAVPADRPAAAGAWLTPEERDWLEAHPGRPSAGETAAAGAVSLRAGAPAADGVAPRPGHPGDQPRRVRASCSGCATVVKGVARRKPECADATPTCLNWTRLVYACGLAGVLALRAGRPTAPASGSGTAWPGSSAAGVFLALASSPGQPWAAVFAWLCVAGFFANFWFTAVLGAADADPDLVGRGRRRSGSSTCARTSPACSARRSWAR